VAGPTVDLPFDDFAARFLEAMGPWRPEEGGIELARHAFAVAKKNEVMNLTRIVEPEAMAVKHALDSLAALPILLGADDAPVNNVLDLGTGAGYPGLALALAMPHLNVTLLDSTRKKVDFLQELVAELGVSDRVQCVWARFEDWIRPHRGRFDMVLARAVGPLHRLLEWCTHRWYGPLLLWKGPAFLDELEEARTTLARRKLDVSLDLPYLLPDDPAERRLIVIDWED